MAVKDMKGFRKRCKMSTTGEKSGADSTIKSKLLAIKYDMDNGAHIIPSRRKFYEKNKHLLK